jgi:F0F1-type ATP synthase assembly protein I
MMRGYRFRREAFKMLKTFLVVWIVGFLLEAGLDWVRGGSPSLGFTALAISACLFMLFAAVLFAIDTVIQRVEKKQPPWSPPEERAAANGPGAASR